MIKLSGKTILIFAAIFYPIKIISLQAIAGGGMACVDSGNCSMTFTQFFLFLCPGYAYLIGGMIYFWEVYYRKTNTKSIDRALSCALTVHLWWLFFTFILCPLFVFPLIGHIVYIEPEKELLFLDMMLTIVLIVIIIGVWSKHSNLTIKQSQTPSH